MIEDAVNRLAAAIEAQTAAMLEGQRQFAEYAKQVSTGTIPVSDAPKTERRGRRPKDDQGTGPAAGAATGADVSGTTSGASATEAAVETAPETAPASTTAPTAPTSKSAVGQLLERQRAEENQTDTRPVSRDDLKDLAMSLSRQDTKFVPDIKAAIAKHGVKTITELPEDAIGVVFAELNNLANKNAREG